MTTIHRTDPQRATSAYSDTLQRIPSSSASASAQATSGAHGATTSPTGAVKAGAIISLSPGAQFFAKALAAAQSSSDVRPDRVAAIQARLAQSDTVDVDALASKMLGGAAPKSGV